MANPVSHTEVNRTCPHCKREVKPGHKFCEVCGTQIPLLFTCSKCGTQFIHKTESCNLCGAPLIPEERPEPDSGETKGPDREVVPEPEPGRAPVLDREEMPEPDEGKIPGPAEERKIIRFARKVIRLTKQIRKPDTDGTKGPDEEEIPEPAEERKIIRLTKQIRKPDTDGTKGPAGEELPEPDLDEAQGPDEEEPEQGTDEIQEPDEEELREPADERKPRRYSREIREPDTAELLAKYGDDYEDEQPVTGWRSRFGRREVSPTADEALFLLGGKQKPAKPLKNRMRIIGAGMIITAVLIAVFFIVLPVLTDYGFFSALGNPPAEEITPGAGQTIATTPPTPTVTPTPASGPLVTRPTQEIPIDQKYYFEVQKNPITQKISVIFIGSAGEDSITRADIRVSHADGSVSTGVILPLKGITEISLNGSEETDRVEIIAALSSGATYRVYDSLFPSVGRI